MSRPISFQGVDERKSLLLSPWKYTKPCRSSGVFSQYGKIFQLVSNMLSNPPERDTVDLVRIPHKNRKPTVTQTCSGSGIFSGSARKVMTKLVKRSSSSFGGG